MRSYIPQSSTVYTRHCSDMYIQNKHFVQIVIVKYIGFYITYIPTYPLQTISSVLYLQHLIAETKLLYCRNCQIGTNTSDDNTTDVLFTTIPTAATAVNSNVTAANITEASTTAATTAAARNGTDCNPPDEILGPNVRYYALVRRMPWFGAGS